MCLSSFGKLVIGFLVLFILSMIGFYEYFTYSINLNYIIEREHFFIFVKTLLFAFFSTSIISSLTYYFFYLR